MNMNSICKTMKFLDVSVFLYIFSLSFIKIGINIFQYTFTIPDAILIIILITFIFKKFNNFNMLVVNKKLLRLYIVFLIGILFSLIDAKNKNAVVAELLAYFYAFCVVFSFSLYIYERKKIALKVIFTSFVVTLIIISFASLTVLFQLEIKRFFLDNFFVFFMRISSQLTIFLLICFYVYLISRKYIKQFWLSNIINMILPLLFFCAVTYTGSRMGMFIAIILIFYSYVDLFRKIKSKYKLFLIIGMIILLLILFLIVIFLMKNNSRSVLFNRAISVFENIKTFSLKGDPREEINYNSFKAFLSNPINGVGLGNIYKQYCKWEGHNSFLSILSETGIIGFIPFVILLGFIFIQGIKYYKRVDFYVVYFCLLLVSNFHHIFRQRWIWVFLTYLVSYMYMENQTKIKNNITENHNEKNF